MAFLTFHKLIEKFLQFMATRFLPFRRSFQKNELLKFSYLKLSLLSILCFGAFSFLTLEYHGTTIDETFCTTRAEGFSQYIKYIIQHQKIISLEEYLKETSPKKPDMYIYYYGAFWPILHYGVSQFVKRHFDLSDAAAEHFPSVLLYLISMVFFALLANQLFGGLGGFASTLLLLTFPRILSHAHNNLKDVPVMAFVIIASYFFVLTLKKGKFSHATLCAFFSAVAATIKFDGAFFVIVLCLSWAVFLFEKYRTSLSATKHYALYLPLTFSFSFLLFYYLFWPTLWFTPLKFIDSLNHFSHNFLHSYKEIYLGKLYVTTAFPWHYIIVNIFTATPISHLVLFIIGTFFLFKYYHRKNYSLAWCVLVLAWFLIPVTIRLMPGAVRYNGIRHIFPAIPAMLLIAGYGFCQLAILISAHYTNRYPAKILISVALSLLMVWNFYDIGRFFPFFHSYHNEFTRVIFNPRVHDYLVSDYWASSYLQAIEWLNHNTKGPARVCPPDNIHTTTKYEIRSSLQRNCADGFDYLILYGNSFINYYLPHDWKKWNSKDYRLIKSLSRANIDVVRIYQHRKSSSMIVGTSTSTPVTN